MLKINEFKGYCEDCGEDTETYAILMRGSRSKRLF